MFPCLDLRERCTSGCIKENIQLCWTGEKQTKNTTKDGVGEQGWYKLNCIEE